MYYNVLFSLSASMRLCRASSSKVSKKTRFPGLQDVTLIKTKPTADTADQKKTWMTNVFAVSCVEFIAAELMFTLRSSMKRMAVDSGKGNKSDVSCWSICSCQFLMMAKCAMHLRHLATSWDMLWDLETSWNFSCQATQGVDDHLSVLHPILHLRQNTEICCQLYNLHCSLWRHLEFNHIELIFS